MRIRLLAPVLVVALVAAHEARAAHCGAAGYGSCSQPVGEAQCSYSACQAESATSYRLVYDTVVEKRWHTTYQTVHETVMKPVTRTVYRDECRTECRPCYESCYRTVEET